jgi:hypothetical protein
MPLKNRRINFKVSEGDFRQINANAKSYGLATGTYLRLLGLSGMSPISEVRQPQAKVSTEAQTGKVPDLQTDEFEASTPKNKDVHRKSRPVQ